MSPAMSRHRPSNLMSRWVSGSAVAVALASGLVGAPLSFAGGVPTGPVPSAAEQQIRTAPGSGAGANWSTPELSSPAEDPQWLGGPVPPALPARTAWGYRPVTPARVLDTRPQPTADGKFSGVGFRGPQSYLDFPVAGRVGVPPATEVAAVVVNITGIAPTSTTYLSAIPFWATGDTSSTLNLARGEVAANLAIVPLFQDDPRISIYNDQGGVHVAVDVVGYFRRAAVDDFYGSIPMRLLDTRAAGSTFDGLQVGIGKLAAGATLSVTVHRAALATALGKIPDPGDTVALNVTGIWPSAFTFLTVFPGGTTRPLASSLNVPTARNVPNLVFARVGADGTVSVYNDRGSLDVAVDLVGYLPKGANFQTLDRPFRLTDTRAGHPTDDGVDAGGGALGPASLHKTTVTGRGVAVIEANATAVAVNLTGVAPTAFTFLAAYPAGTTRPTVSTVNLPVGAVRPNAAVVPLGNGAITTYNEAGTIDIVVDASARVLPSDPRVGGWITGPADQPLAGATVVATSPFYPFTSVAPATVTAKTAADGSYELRLPAPGRWRVCASAAGFQERCWSGGGPVVAPGDVFAVWSYSGIRIDLALP